MRLHGGVAVAAGPDRLLIVIPHLVPDGVRNPGRACCPDWMTRVPPRPKAGLKADCRVARTKTVTSGSRTGAYSVLRDLQPPRGRFGPPVARQFDYYWLPHEERAQDSFRASRWRWIGQTGPGPTGIVPKRRP